MRSTQYYQIALERLAEHLGVTVEDAPESGKGAVRIDLRSRVPEKHHDDEWTMNGYVYTGGKKYVLARLVMAALMEPTVGWAMSTDEVAEVIKLTEVNGKDRGLKGHEWNALKSVLS